MHVTVMSRPECHLCEVAEQQVAAICADVGATYEVSNVDDDAELRAEYGDMVPVILIDGQQHTYWHVDDAKLRAALQP